MSLKKLVNWGRALSLMLPLSDKQKVVIYYKIFTDFFEVISEGSGLLNYGQEALCLQTAETLPKKGDWLDVGCGIGGPARLLTSEYQDVNVTGINISDLQINEGNRRTSEAGLSERVTIQKGDACKMPFDGDRFDALYAIETAFHFPDKKAFASEAHRNIRKNGKFACADMVMAEDGVSKTDSFKSRLFHEWLGILNMNKVSNWQTDLTEAGFKNIAVEDVTQTVLVDGLTKANERIDKWRHKLKKDYPWLLIELVKWGNRWTITDLEKKPVRYVIITADA